MRLSLWAGVRQPWPALLDAAEHVDRERWDGLYVADHFMRDVGDEEPVETPTLESTSVLAALAVSTRSVRLGSLVLSTTYRHPAVVANWAATVDNLSGGRLVLGLGAGWQANEHVQYGIDLPPPGERLRRFDEACQVVLGLLRHPTTTFAGTYYQLSEAICEPKPLQARLPLLIGGRRDRMLGIVARYADEWNIWATPAAFAGPVEELTGFATDLVTEGADELIVPDQFLGHGTARLATLSAIRGALADL